MGTISVRLQEPVLILNVNYEPLHVCNTRRALALLIAARAEIVLNGRGKLRAGSAEFDLPSIIKLRQMIRRPHPHLALSKREILQRDNYVCQYCGRHSNLITIDHIIPRHLNGPHTWQNLVAACYTCNRRKGGKTLEQANMTLLRPPYEPSPTARYRFGKYLTQRAEWEPFIEGW